MKKILALAFLLSLWPVTSRADFHHRELIIAHQSNTPGFDLLSLALAPGATFISPFPSGIAPLSEPVLFTALAATFKVRDAATDAVLGVGSEMENIHLDTLVADSHWTVVFPGRGTIFGAQQETLAPLIAIVQDMISRGVFEQTFDPPLVVVTTLPDSGSVVGGSGEFAGAKGTMVETDTLHYISLLTGTLTVDDTVEFLWK